MIEPGALPAQLDESQLAAIAEAALKKEEERIVRLNSLALSLGSKRRTAIDNRAASGIEQIWLEDEDAFDGIDDANRAQEGAQGTRHRFLKPTSSAGRVITKNDDVDENACILLPNITAPYAEAGAASIADILLPLDEWPFALDPTPVPELTQVLEQMGDMPDEQMVQMPGMQQPAQAGALKAEAEQVLQKAKKCAEKAETRIKDWLTECQWHGKSRRQIDDAARVGTGIVKGPVPSMKKQYSWQEEGGVKKLTIKEEIKPITDNVDFWNLFPDYPACGENIHNGSFVFERGEITHKTLQGLRGQDGCIDSQIELCLQEGPIQAEVYPGDKQPKDGTFEIWWFHGALEREDVEAAGCDCSDQPEGYISIPAVITVVNNRIIRAALNHLDKGSFPYDILTWRRRPGMPWGQGIPRQIRPAQRGFTACFRALMENAGLSAKPMIAVLRKYLFPQDQSWQLFGGKVFEVSADADVRDIKAAITTLQVDSRQAELLGIMQFLLKMAEDITGQPALLQGQQGKAPDTVGVTTILNNNASVTRRRIARQFDDQVIEPGIGRYYDYLMQYGEDEEEKGLFVIDARASSVLVERDTQNQGIMQLMGASVNQAYGANPRKVFAAACKALKIAPDDLQYTDEEWKQIQENAAKQPADPRIQVAQINAELKAQVEAGRIQSESIENERDRQNALIIAAIDERMNSTELTSAERQNLDKIKGTLSGKVIEVKAQQQLTRENMEHQKDVTVAGHKMDLHKHRNPSPDVIKKPAVEPPGRAAEGQAFVQ